MEWESANNEDKKLPSNRSFGFVFTGFFCLVGLLPLVKGGNPRAWAFIIAAAVLFITLLFPSALTAPNRLWAKFGDVLHRIMSPVVLGIMFFLVFVPMGVVMRMFGWNPLKRDYDPASKSYWIKRNPPGPQPDSMKDQF